MYSNFKGRSNKNDKNLNVNDDEGKLKEYFKFLTEAGEKAFERKTFVVSKNRELKK